MMNQVQLKFYFGNYLESKQLQCKKSRTVSNFSSKVRSKVDSSGMSSDLVQKPPKKKGPVVVHPE